MNPLFKPYVILDKRQRWQAHTQDIKELFGLHPRLPWPTGGMPVRVIQGFTCWVYPLEPKKFKIRAYCSCKLCGKAVPIGRLRQHVKGHENNPAMVQRVQKEQAA